ASLPERRSIFCSASTSFSNDEHGTTGPKNDADGNFLGTRPSSIFVCVLIRTYRRLAVSIPSPLKTWKVHLCATACLAGLCLAMPARADFIYSNFNSVNSTSGGQTLQLNGNAGLTGGVLRLTPSSFSQSGSAFTTNAISLGNNASFSTYFQFRLSNSG